MDLTISGIRERIFNNTQHEKTVARASNPFAASTFKGNVLTADVFESSSKNNQPSFTGATKLKASALVGSLNDMMPTFGKMIQSAVEFGNRIKDNVVNTWRMLDDINIGESINHLGSKLNDSISSMFETGMSVKSISSMDSEALTHTAKPALQDLEAAWASAIA